MAFLRDANDGAEHTLTARHWVGRSAACSLRLDHPEVSGEHATIAWNEQGWRLKDLGSRNGTTVDDHRVTSGAWVPLVRGSTVGFGGARVFVLVDDSPPVAQAVHVESGDVRVARGDVLLLPDQEAPRLSVFRDGAHWIAADDEDAVRVVDHAVVEADGAWRLYLPTPTTPTVGTDPRALRLVFHPSSDLEHVELVVERQGPVAHVGARRYHRLLLELAQRRLAESDQPEPERGWVHRAELAAALFLSPATINTQLHRARQGLGQLGVDGLAALVQRRAGTGQIRLATDHISIE